MANIMRLGASVGTGKQKIFLAVPVYDRAHPHLAYNLVATDREFAEAGLSLDLQIIQAHCHVDDMRNMFVRDFLESDATDLVFIDADVSWKPRDLIKLCSYDRDVVAGIYPYKSDNGDFPCNLIPGDIWSDNEGLIEVAGVPTGFLRIRRAALEKLAAAAPQYLNAPTEFNRRRIAIIFERTLEGGTRFSGDYAFCRKWRALGGKVFIDPSMYFGHFGDKEWVGCFGDFLKHRAGLGYDRLDLIARGVETDDDLLALDSEWGNGWSVSPEFLVTTIALARKTSGTAIECGSGLTSLVMAAANPNLHVHALESSPAWADKLRNVIDQRNIKNITLHVRPLIEYPDGKWYNIEGLPRSGYDLALIDGPSRISGTRSVVYDQIDLTGTNVIVDDAGDPYVHGPLVRWARDNNRKLTVLGQQRAFALALAA